VPVFCKACKQQVRILLSKNNIYNIVELVIDVSPLDGYLSQGENFRNVSGLPPKNWNYVKRTQIKIIFQK
jgi:hypothetical protein